MSSKKPKVLQVNKFYNPVVGGIERIVQQLAEGLNNQTDTKVLVCTPKGRGGTEQISGVTVHRAGSLGTAFSMPIALAFPFAFRNLAEKCDIVHLHMPFPLGDLAVFLSGYKGRLVLWWHSDIVKQKRLLKLYRPLLMWTLARADAIVVATEGHIYGSDFLEPFRKKCRIIAYGLEASIMEQSEKTPTRTRNVPFSILFVGRLVYYKGCDVLLDAFASIPLTDAMLTLIGTGPLKEALVLQTRRLGIEDRVIFKQDLTDEELSEEFAKCDVFVLPSVAKSEAFGLVQIEAMAYKKPVINTNLASGVPYVSLDGITGLTVPPKDAEALSLAMLWMYDHPEEAKTMGENARERVLKEYQIDKMLNVVLCLYRELCGI